MNYYDPNAHQNYSAAAQNILLQKTAQAFREVHIHSLRVADLAGILAEIAGWNVSAQKEIQWAGFYHDLGKHYINPEILTKEEPLTPFEWEEIKTHPEKSLKNFLSPASKQAQSIPGKFSRSISVCTALVQHHERWDGGGYPKGLEKKQIHPLSSLVGLADVIDALSGDRCYRARLEFDGLVESIFEGRNKQWAPGVTDLFLNNLELFKSVLSYQYT